MLAIFLTMMFESAEDDEVVSEMFYFVSETN